MPELNPAQMADPGTRQADRLNPHLDPAYAPLDDREPADLVLAASALAARLNYFDASSAQPDGTWQDILLRPLPGETADRYRQRVGALLQTTDGSVPPHLALLMAYAQLARHPRAQLNDFTRQHLNFQMQTVLAFSPKAAQPDHAHVVLALKKGAPSVEVKPGQYLSAGKDKQQNELLYDPVRPTVLNHAKVASLRAVTHAGRRLVCAPVADSVDGVGGKLPPDNAAWSPFAQPLPDRPSLPGAATGFALQSGLLRLAEGTRTITFTLYLDGLQSAHSAEALAASFEVLLTGPKGWIGPYALQPVSATDKGLRKLQFTLADDQPAVVDIAALHGQPFEPGLPVAQLLIKADGPLGHDDLAALSLDQVKLAVSVQGMRKLVLESELGLLDAKKPFLPFGAQPSEGSRCFVGCEEALGKPLTNLSLKLVWQGAPTTQTELTTRYSGYTHKTNLASGVSVQADWADARAEHKQVVRALLPAASEGNTLELEKVNLKIRKLNGPVAYALHKSGSSVARILAEIEERLHHKRSDEKPVPATVRPGFVTLTLLTDLLHNDYRTDAVTNLLLTSPVVIKEPYTPKLKELTLSYDAESGLTPLNKATQSAFVESDLAFYHVDVFGVAREHLWLNTQRRWARQRSSVTLMPRHTAAGELFIGLSGVQGGEPVSLLLQALEGSADPLAHVQDVRWAVLSDNTWQALPPGPDLPLDTSNSLRRSGIVQIVLPESATSDNTRLPAGFVWLRAAIPAEPRAACQLLAVHANAIEVAYVEQGHGAAHLADGLPAGKIARFKSPLAEVKALSQPDASFGGALQEDDAALSRRAAERLRHRGRAITAWDHERLVLEAFPGVDRVKCIPYANSQSWHAPGCVMLVVVPNLRQRNTMGVLQPRVDLDTLDRIERFVLPRSAMCMRARPAGQNSALTVRNPRYQAVKLSFKVHMRDGFAFSFYKSRLNEAVVQTLSPWAFDVSRPLNFGGRVVRSAVIDAIEALPYVDYVTDVRLAREDHPGEDHSELGPQEPDVILVSAAEHQIEEIV